MAVAAFVVFLAVMAVLALLDHGVQVLGRRRRREDAPPAAPPSPRPMRCAIRWSRHHIGPPDTGPVCGTDVPHGSCRYRRVARHTAPVLPEPLHPADVPAGYPREFEREVLLRDGRVVHV